MLSVGGDVLQCGLQLVFVRHSFPSLGGCQDTCNQRHSNSVLIINVS